MAPEKTAAVIVIGNEVLSGKVQDSNATFLVRELRELGVPLKAVHVIPDEPDAIARTVAAASREFDYVFTTGGVGPTHDDMTIPAIARGLGLELVTEPQLEDLIRRFYKSETNEYLLRMSRVPAGTELLWDNGLLFPVVTIRNIYVFPGDPTIFKRKFAAIRHRFLAEPFALRKLFTTCDEGELAALMEEAERLHPGVQIGSYPVYEKAEYKVQITMESKDASAANAALAFLRERIPASAIVRME